METPKRSSARERQREKKLMNTGVLCYNQRVKTSEPKGAVNTVFGSNQNHFLIGENSMARKHRTSIDLTGQQFGRWTVLSFSTKRLGGHRYFDCLCKCGTVRSVLADSLLRGTSESCGCYMREVVTHHGHSAKSKPSSEYLSWRAMMSRCYAPKSTGYHRYGGRGIVVCERWHSFPLFLADMGLKPTSRLSIERNNRDGNYEPINCRWATYAEQARNTSQNNLITFNGETMCIADWATRIGITPQALKNRLHKWSLENAMTLHGKRHRWARLGEA